MIIVSASTTKIQVRIGFTNIFLLDFSFFWEREENKTE